MSTNTPSTTSTSTSSSSSSSTSAGTGTTASAEHRIAAAPTPSQFGAEAAVDCPSCGTYPARSYADATERAEWCRKLGHGAAEARRLDGNGDE